MCLLYALVCKGCAFHILFMYIIMKIRHETNVCLFISKNGIFIRNFEIIFNKQAELDTWQKTTETPGMVQKSGYHMTYLYYSVFTLSDRKFDLTKSSQIPYLLYYIAVPIQSFYSSVLYVNGIMDA